MKVYTTDKIRNIALLGHGGSGKTSLVEAMANIAGMTSRMGRVDDGNTISDYDKEEQKRKFSISTSVIPIEYTDKEDGQIKINLLDTPGYFDFVGEVEEAVGAADGAVIVVSAKDGVQVGTEKSWNRCEDKGLPRIIYLSEMDFSDTEYPGIIESLHNLYGNRVAPIHVQIKDGGKFTGYVDVVAGKAYMFGDKGKVTEAEVPESLSGDVETYHDALMESVAETSEEFMERYFGGDEFTLFLQCGEGDVLPDQFVESIRSALKERQQKEQLPYDLNISVGYDSLRDRNDTLAAALVRADQKLYEYKRAAKIGR